MTRRPASPLPETSFPLFLPGDRPDRIPKACTSGSDMVIVDLEDGVAPEAKTAARAGLFDALPDAPPVPLLLRLNAPRTTWYEDDLVLAAQPGVSGVMLPKAETVDELAALRARLRPGQVIIALVESARGLAAVETLAPHADRLAFGSIDYAVDIGCEESHEALLFARSRMVLAARLAGRPAPLDGVTTAIGDTAVIEHDAAHASGLGFGGKLLIHPAQIGPALDGFAPSLAQIEWAERVLTASTGGAMSLDGEMIDEPVILRARAIRERASLSSRN
ncbi:MAG: CoA ester lyase [Hyphomonas sp.]|nr:CoA ester lyase [Hyphomonas sp.]